MLTADKVKDKVLQEDCCKKDVEIKTIDKNIAAKD